MPMNRQHGNITQLIKQKRSGSDEGSLSSPRRHLRRKRRAQRHGSWFQFAMSSVVPFSRAIHRHGDVIRAIILNGELFALFLVSATGVWFKLVLGRGGIFQIEAWDVMRSLVIAAATFPIVYRAARRSVHLQSHQLIAFRFFIAFQNGFFWESLLEKLG